jgi:protein-S-isoprenylcysteine O-methyltransferase Ste14
LIVYAEKKINQFQEGKPLTMNTITTPDSKVRRGATRWLARETLGNLILIAMLFGIVGRWNWWNGWVLSAIYILWSASCAILILPVNPTMLAERARPHADKRKWDTVLLGLMGAFMICEYILASLDVRLDWSSQMPLVVQLIGLLAAVLGQDVLLVWSMASNAFFVATFRIQTDRQHAVASDGPYRYVRHPGYLSAILMHLGIPFLLNSLWAIIPGVLVAVVLTIRTAVEDKTLQAELPGYVEYTHRVRYRLIPGVW